MSSFIKWVAGILAAVISSVLIYYLTTYLQHLNPPAPSQTSIQIEGRVIDLQTKSFIENARVTLRAGRYSGSQATDSLGRYGFDVPLPETTEATFVIDAEGYPRYSINGTLKKLSEVEDDQLLHEAVGAGNTSTGNVAVPPANQSPSQEGSKTGGVSVPPPPPTSSSPQGGAVSGGVTAGGKGAAIGALLGAVVNHSPAGPKTPAASPPPPQSAAKAKVVLPPYVRRRDLVKVGQ